MRVRIAIVAVAFGFLTCSSAGATDQENVEKTVDKYLSSFDAPKKGLCICIGDGGFPQGRKRVGVIRRSFQADGSGGHVAVNCDIPGYDASGALIGQVPVTCADWVPLSK
jgi:hypothetical protein